MACVSVLSMKSLARTCLSSNSTSGVVVNPSIIRPLSSFSGHKGGNGGVFHSRAFSFEPRSGTHQRYSPTLLRSHVLVGYSLFKMGPISGFHPYSSISNEEGGEKGGLEGVSVSRTSDVDVSGDVNYWMDKVKDVWNSITNVAAITGSKVKEVSDEVVPYVQQVVDSHPYVRDIVVPVGGTLIATLMAWVVFPWVLKRMHEYSTKGTAALLHGSVFSVEIPYEKSIWCALEDPVRYLITFMAFSEICYLVAPNIITQYIGQTWKGAIVLSFIWFLQRCKTNLFARALGAQNVHFVDRDTLLILDKVTSVGLLTIGVMALAEAFGVAVQSILTVGGIGGFATAFAAKDILGNVLSGLSMQFSRPFSIGDTIRAGSVEGQVMEMGLTTTSLLNAEKFPVIVPNSLFSSQVIVNKSRAKWRAFANRIPLRFHNLENIPKISDDIKSMLKSNPNVFLGKEAPYCYLTRIDTSYAELTLGCNLKRLSKEEQYNTEQDILLQSIQIIKQHGASLGNS